MRKLPVDDRGYPVPWFVSWIDGKPEFRAADREKLHRATKFHMCWVCGEPVGRYSTFVIGPMCGINRVSSEPPCHRDCAEFSAIACPFLTRPKARRRDAGLDQFEWQHAAGDPILRNPGVALIWITRKWRTFKAPGGFLFEIGDPEEILWFCEGRVATNTEIDESIRTGLPLLQESAREEGTAAERALQKAIEKFNSLREYDSPTIPGRQESEPSTSRVVG